MSWVAFDAGSIEAKLTLDRDPFQTGLDEAKAEAQRFSDGAFAAKLDADSTALNRKLDDAETAVKRFATEAASAKLDVDNAPAITKIAEANTAAEEFASTSASARLDVDNTSAITKIQAAEVEAQQFADTSASAVLDVDSALATEKIQAAELEAQQFADTTASAELDVDDTAARAKIDELRAELDALGGASSTPRIDVDTSQAAGKIAAVDASVSQLGDRRVAPRIDADDTGARQVFSNVDRDIKALTEAPAQVELQAADGATPKIASASSAARAFGVLDAHARLTADTTDVTKNVAVAKAATDALVAEKKAIKIDMDLTVLQSKLATARANLATLQEHGTDLAIDANIQPWLDKVTKVEADIERLRAQRSSVEIDAKIDDAETKLAFLMESLQRAGDADVTVQVKASTDEAMAKLAALELQEATLSAQQVSLQVDAASVDAATQSLGDMVGVVDAAAAAFPPVSAAIVAIPGALQLLIDPLGAVALGVDGIKNSASGLLPAFDALKAQVSGTFELGMKPAITDINNLMPTLQTGLSGSAIAATAVATSVLGVASSKDGIAELSTTFQNVDATISGMAPGIGSLVSNFLKLGAEGSAGLTQLDDVINQVGAEWDAVVARLSTTGLASAAVGSLVDDLGGLLGILPPLVEAGVRLQATIGPPLAVALNLVGSALSFLTGPMGTVTNIALAMAAAWKITTVASALVTTGAQAVGAAWASVTGGATAAAVAEGAAATSTTAAAAAAATAASTLSAQAVASAAAAAAAEANAVALAAAAEAATVEAVAAGLGATSEAELAIATEAAAVAATAQTAAAEGAAAALSAQAVAADAAAVSSVAAAEATTASSAAAGTAAGTATRFSGVMSKLGASLPIVGIALVGIGLAYQALVPNAEDAASAMLKGGDAASAAAEKLKEQNAQFTEGSLAAKLFGVSQQDINTEIEKQISQMGPLEAAQARVNLAQTAWNDAVRDFTPNSQQARDAASALATANADLARAQSDAKIQQVDLNGALSAAATHFGPVAGAAEAAARAAVSWSDALKGLANPLSLASDKAKAFNDAFAGASDPATQLAVAIQADNDAVRGLGDALTGANPKLLEANGTINTTTKAGSDLQTAILASAGAFDGLYGATIAAEQGTKGMAQAQADATVAVEGARQKFMDQATAAGFNAGAVKLMADQLFAIPKEVTTQLTQPGMVQAIADSMGLKDSIAAIPSDKSVVVNSLTADAKAQLTDLGLTVTTLPNGKILITADAGQVPGVVATAKGLADSTIGTITLTGNPDPVNGTTQAAVAFADGSTGTVTIDGNPTLANGKVTDTVTFADGSKGTIVLDGNPNPATGQIDGVVSYGNGKTSTVHVAADASAAIGTINGIPRDIYITAHVTASSNVNSAGGLAAGGILTPMAAGGIIANAGGNLLGGLTPMAGGIAQTVAPNTWRVIGDNLQVPESYIPQDGSPRSQAILAQTATAMGFGLIPEEVLDALRSTRPIGSDGASMPSIGSRVSVSAPTSGAADSNSAVVGELRQLRAELAALKGRGGAAITNNYYTESSLSQADATVRVQRRQAALGLFGGG